MNNNQFTIITFYQFKDIDDLQKIQQILKELCFFHKIKGTILIAKEGINGTVAGLSNSIIFVKEKLNDLNFDNLQIKESLYEYMPFSRLKIKIKKEIVTFDGNNYNVNLCTAKHIKSEKWNQLIKDKNTNNKSYNLIISY